MNYKGLVSRAIITSPELKKSNLFFARQQCFGFNKNKLFNGFLFPRLETQCFYSNSSAFHAPTGLAKLRAYVERSYPLLSFLHFWQLRQQSPPGSGLGVKKFFFKKMALLSKKIWPNVSTKSTFKAVLFKKVSSELIASKFTPKTSAINAYNSSTSPSESSVTSEIGVNETKPETDKIAHTPYPEEVRDSRLATLEGLKAADKGKINGSSESSLINKRPIFPFTAIVGQEEMKLALLLNVIDPKIGGVMIMGDRGTGKSTTVRALVDLLPNIEVVENDSFNSHPSDAELMSQHVREQILKGNPLNVVSKKTAMIDLPLGATEDRVCGTIDIEKALSEGVKAFEPGLLAKANRGILYVDEVNLLDDHLVDILLDSAASGWNTVEREGISISHPARFILVGSGNPEEGELRPQLLDRFGMHAQIGTVREAELRVKIVEERASFDQSPMEFLKVHAEKQKQLADKIVAARHLLGAVKIDYDLRVKISQICGQLNVDGLRGDIVTNLAG